MTRMKRTPLSSSYMFVVKWVNLVLLVNDLKLLLENICDAFNFLFNYLTSSSTLSAIFFVWWYYDTSAVKSDKLKWLPNGSELPCEDVKPNAGSKPKTFTSFTCSQDSLPEFSNNSIGLTYSDIILAKLGPGQVTFFSKRSVITLRFYGLRFRERSVNFFIVGTFRS